MDTQLAQISSNEPLFDPNFLNLEYFFNLVIRFFDFLKRLLEYLAGLGVGDFSFLENFLWILIILLIIGIAYSLYNYAKIRETEREKYTEAHWEAMVAIEETERNERWEKVLSYLDSPNESDWRLAIIEADTLLESVLESMQYSGESIGEMLRGIEPSDFTTLAQAWDAHKVRNKITHEGSHFLLTKREATRVISLYQEVFEEFHFI